MHQIDDRTREGIHDRFEPVQRPNGLPQRLQGAETVQVRLPHWPAEGQVGTPPLTFDFDQTRLMEFLQVMRDGRRTNDFMLIEFAACQAIARRHLPEDREPSRISKRTPDRTKLFL